LSSKTDELLCMKKDKGFPGKKSEGHLRQGEGQKKREKVPLRTGGQENPIYLGKDFFRQKGCRDDARSGPGSGEKNLGEASSSED